MKSRSISFWPLEIDADEFGVVVLSQELRGDTEPSKIQITAEQALWLGKLLLEWFGEEK